MDVTSCRMVNIFRCLEVNKICENVCQPTALRHRRLESAATPQSEHQIFSKIFVTTTNFQQIRCYNLKSSATLLSKSSDPQRHLREPQIFSNTAVIASTLSQNYEYLNLIRYVIP
jgi:hypothetical protein